MLCLAPGAVVMAFSGLAVLQGRVPAVHAVDIDATYFENRVRPLLAERCIDCHGPAKSKSGLRLDSLTGLLAGGARGPAIVPGDPEGSVLINAVRYDDEDLLMPPRGKLADGEIELLVEWIRAGAPGPLKTAAESEGASGVPGDQGTAAEQDEAFDLASRAGHWAFQPLREIHAGASVDELLDARLRREGLSAAGEAAPRDVLRRLAFDLTGLPPEPGWLDAQAGRPFAETVDDLLDSPHYGERWARHWLDLVRYAEGRGHEYDHDIPNAYQYRDYVLRAFNEDVPYDRFVVEHIAGDLLAQPRLDPDSGSNESVLGTGFWFLGPEVHSPVDIRADETDRTANKVDVLSRTFLGLTVACARCHDHKFDAISTEDYYALCGFALSGGYRQVRFDTIEHNGALARELESLRREHEPRLEQALGAYLEGQALQVSEHLEAAGALAFDASRADDAGPSAHAYEPVEGVDLLFDDFERDDYAPWTTTGTAFGSGPKRREDLAEYHNVEGQRGRFSVNTHNTEGDEDVVAGDAHVGTLSSPWFTIERDWIHFLICGGEHETTAVRLVLEGDAPGASVASASGVNTAQLEPAAFDVHEWRGQSARLVVVDEHSEGWGNIGLDHVVFSDRADPEVLEIDLWPRAAARRARLVHEQAQAHGLEVPVLEAWARELGSALETEDSLLHTYAFLAATTRGLDDALRERQFDYVLEALRSRAVPDAGDLARVVVDYGELDPSRWFQDGFGFVARDGGALLVPGEDLDLARVAGAYWDATWDVLTTAEETQVESEHSLLGWETAGRTLRTPTVTLESGRLFSLVRGAGHVLAAVDEHRMVRGPLHTGTVLDFETSGEGFTWIEHDLAAYAGHRVALEFSPRRREGRASELAVARVVEAPGTSPGTPPGTPPGLSAQREVLRLLADGEATLGGLAQRYEEACRAAARRLRDGAPPEPGDVELLAWLAERSGPRPGLPQPFAARRAELLERIQPVSRVAPAMLDGTGIDEFVLLRGNSRTPGHVVPRRFLEVFDTDRALIDGAGSGRLELARRLVDPQLPLLARVWANRVWQHLLGRGIVATVDDFGRMGQEPSHPELLDYLAHRLIASDWSTKALVREIVSSAAYRRSSEPSPLALERDPDNVLLSHANRRRLEAEAIRDALLCVSGALDPTLYGPPVPLHLTDFLQGRGRPEVSGPVDGEGRRSLYLAVRRNFPEPFLQVFDFPPPATTMGRRSLSNVPAQALTLLNDPFVLGQAERWAERVLAARDLSAEQRITHMYRTAFAREPDPAELHDALTFVQGRCAQYELDRDGQAPVGEDDPRAWSALAHVLFNLKEFIYLD